MGASPGSRPDPEEVRSRAEEILSRLEFQPDQPNLAERALDWIGDRLGELLQVGVEGPGDGAWAGVILIVAILGAVGYMVWRFARRMRPEAEEPASIDHADEQRSARAWLEAAERFEADGDLKEALRCRFRALVATLADRDVVRELSGRTAGELRAEVRGAAPEAAAPFSAAAEIFELAWYSDMHPGPAELKRFRSLAGEVLVGAET